MWVLEIPGVQEPHRPRSEWEKQQNTDGIERRPKYGNVQAFAPLSEAIGVRQVGKGGQTIELAAGDDVDDIVPATM